MRILIHTDEYYPTAQACSYRMRTMADAFIDQGDEIVVIASSTNKGNGKIEPRREKILYSPAIRMKKKTTVMRMLNNFSFGFTSIFTSLKAGKIDVVITTSPPPLVSIPGWIIAKCKGAKLVFKFAPIVIHDNCFIGMRSTLLPGIEIGPNSVIAAGSVVTRSVPPGEVWGGVPAHFIETTKEYADKCKETKLPYDMQAYNTDMKAELLRVTHQAYKFFK